MDQVGTTHALTTLSPIHPERMRELTNRLRVVRYTPGLSRPILQLAFIHYARWMILEWLPPPTGTGGWRGLRWKYLLFESNYDGRQADYLRTFADVLPARLAALWSACFGFDFATRPGVGEGAGILAPFGFQRFVELNQLEIVDLHAAYPNSTTIDVRQAISLHEVLREASDDSAEDDESARRLAGKVSAVALGPVSPPLPIRQRVRAIHSSWGRSVRGQYGVNPLAIITPLGHEGEARLRDACRGGSVLGGLSETQTHFARLVIVPRQLTDLGQPDADMLDTSYLLFTSDAWGTAYNQIETIRTHLGKTADLIWGGCPGYPDDRERSSTRFHAWVNSHTLPVRYYVAGYPPRSVSEIKRLLEERHKVARTFLHQPHPSLGRFLAEVDHDGD